MKKEIIGNLTIENYLNHIICFLGVSTTVVLGVLIKVAYFIDVSSMFVL